MNLFFIIGLISGFTSCQSIQNKQISLNSVKSETQNKPEFHSIKVGAENTVAYLDLLKNKNIGVLTNQTSVMTVNNQSFHLVDFLLKEKIKIKTIFAPEHGFRGTADAGELIKDGKDSKTGLPVVSLYGNNKKPKAEDLKDLDILVFDLQDVGARFYTYISSLHYLMEACAELNKTIIVLDRPNPNIHIIDGPILDMKHQSFVGMHPIPVLHGMTIGEYAQMINGEQWLSQGIKANLIVVPVMNYNRKMNYSLPVRPSPNLPNDQSINLYASLCFFEGTNVSVGRGTEMQFQIYGSPFIKNKTFSFTPKPNFGAKDPMHNGKVCLGEDLTNEKPLNQLEIKWLIDAYQNTSNQKDFFNDFFVKLAGTEQLKQQIEKGETEKKIRNSWQNDLTKFKKMRTKYLIYK
jgi:uncharacterized protein YbbC (DUF1343 family)